MTPLLMFTLLAIHAAPDLSTVAARSANQRTGRYEEVIRLCPAFEKAYPGRVRCLTFGTTPEGRPMLALVASMSGALDPATAHKKNLPVVLFQGGIHAGEIDGKDAGFALLKDLLDGKAAPGLLSKVTAVFVPVFNVDGHERFGPHNRPNQVGPVEMGWRVTAQNLNLNRDYLKADSPEMNAMLALLHTWDPIVYLDLHVTDGADFQPDVSIMMEPVHVGPEPLRVIGKPWVDQVLTRLTAQGHTPLNFYPSFNKDDDPQSGFSVGIAPPRFSQGYWSLNNRFGVLVETHSWKPYAVRVKATYDTVLAFLELAARDGASLLNAAHEADVASEKLPGTRVPLAFDHTKTSVALAFPGYLYRREPSAISGALMVTYDPTHPQTWNIPFFPEPMPVVEVDAPRAGYIIPAAWADRVKPRLAVHAITYTQLKNPSEISAAVFRVKERTFRAEPYEGHHTVAVKGAWSVEKRVLPAGSLYVPVAQRAGMLAIHLLEPLAPDSLMSWGFFNATLEQKEYMEPYVAEQVARQMLAKDPALAVEFERRLSEDPAFAKDPEARLNFFYRRHPSFDDAMNLYPVVRVDAAPQ